VRVYDGKPSKAIVKELKKAFKRRDVTLHVEYESENHRVPFINSLQVGNYPFQTAKNLSGFTESHSRIYRYILGVNHIEEGVDGQATAEGIVVRTVKEYLFGIHNSGYNDKRI